MADGQASASRPRKAVSPYDLFPGDSPGNVITPITLKGENYEEWSRAVRGALRARRKYGFVDGTLKQPVDSPTELEDWLQVNSLVASWVYNTIDEKTRKTVSYKENAREMWVDLEQRFNLTSGPRVQQIKKAIANCRQNGESVMSYYGRIKKLWDDLTTFDQTPTCDCAGCKCGISTKLDRIKEEERLHQFLMGLDDTIYRNVRSTILGLDPLPNVNRAYQRVMQEEQLGDIAHEQEIHAAPVGFVAKAAMPSPPFAGDRKFSSTSDLFCSHCKRTGHDFDHCFHRVGFPEWWTDRSKGRGRGLPSKFSPRNRGQQPARANAATN